jgi:hypothetical protein
MAENESSAPPSYGPPSGEDVAGCRSRRIPYGARNKSRFSRLYSRSWKSKWRANCVTQFSLPGLLSSAYSPRPTRPPAPAVRRTAQPCNNPARPGCWLRAVVPAVVEPEPPRANLRASRVLRGRRRTRKPGWEGQPPAPRPLLRKRHRPANRILPARRRAAVRWDGRRKAT